MVTDLRLSRQEREHILLEAIKMYVKGDEEQKVKGKTYEGKMWKGEHGLMGTFSGQKFTAELDTNDGTAKLAFLIAEYLSPELN